MDINLQFTAQRFVENMQVLDKLVLFGPYRASLSVGSYIFLSHQQDVNEEMYTLCKTIIREPNGIFSTFRGNAEFILTCMLAVDADPGYKMSLALAAYQQLRDVFFPTAYLPFVAFIMADTIKADNFYHVSAKARDIHDRFNLLHSYLTSNEDVPFATLFAIQRTKSIDGIVKEAEQIYQALEKSLPTLFGKNVLQTISHALTLCAGKPPQKVERFITLLNRLSDQRINFTINYELASLAILANLAIDLETIEIDFLSVYQYLKDQPYYNLFNAAQRRKDTIMILASYYTTANLELISAVTTAALLEIQQQQAAAAAAA
ncbi:MAG: DUF4003 family protein [Solobacterium sp.]|nr:DUF4003 family protein [Solobacterium sp.]